MNRFVYDITFFSIDLANLISNVCFKLQNIRYLELVHVMC